MKTFKNIFIALLPLIKGGTSADLCVVDLYIIIGLLCAEMITLGRGGNVRKVCISH